MAAAKRRSPVQSVSPRTGKSTRRRRSLQTTAGAGMLPTMVRAREAAWPPYVPKAFAVGLLISLLYILYEFFYSPTYYVSDFDAAGLNRLTREEIVSAGAFVGSNVFFVDPFEVEHRLEALPEIKSAHVSTVLWNPMTVQVAEREPELAWVTGTSMYWVDRDGIGFRARVILPDLPTVRDMDVTSVEVGKLIQPDAIAAVRALRLAWPEGPRSFEWSILRGLSMTEEHGWKIYVGYADGMGDKVAKLRALVGQLAAQNAKIKYIDLSKGDPFYQ